TATQDYFFTTGTASLQLRNLDPNNAYRFQLLASRENASNRITRYELSGLNEASGTLQSSGTGIGAGAYDGNNNKLFTSSLLFPNDAGTMTLTISRAAGDFAYLNAMRLTEYRDVELCPVRDANTIVVMGSSVARGQGAPADRGYAFQYDALLEERFTAGEGADWTLINKSVGGDNTPKLLNRWSRDLLPECGAYVIYGLSLANEGIRNGGQQVFEQFRDNMELLIEQALAEGITPVVVGNYARADFDAGDYAFIRQINLLIQEWDVPSINVLGTIDNGSGRWADGFQADAGHPNQAGHREFTYAFVPSLFDALDMGKAQPRKTDSTVLTMGQLTGPEQLVFEPEATVHAFTQSFEMKTDDTGTVARFLTADGEGYLIVDTMGLLLYQSPAGDTIQSGSTVHDGDWHNITLTHFYARGETILYVDGVALDLTLSEKLEPNTFFLGSAMALNEIDFRNWLFYRSGMNADEIAALNDGRMLKSSLELYAPLDEAGVLGDDPLVNLAQSTNTIRREMIAAAKTLDHAQLLPVQVFPNPNSGHVQIKNRYSQPITKMLLFDANGKVLQHFENNVAVDMERFPAGLYYLQLTMADGVVVYCRVVRM
ncbi:MAG: GDSL-type esterase/lipase family protein, partial [Bacteroidota bacterium]